MGIKGQKSFQYNASLVEALENKYGLTNRYIKKSVKTILKSKTAIAIFNDYSTANEKINQILKTI